MTTMAIHITGDAAADQVLTDSPFALIVGMMLDQQYPMEHAFRGPHKVLTRFGSLEPAAIAAADPEQFATLCPRPRRSPATAARWPPGCRRWRLWSRPSTPATQRGCGPRRRPARSCW